MARYCRIVYVERKRIEQLKNEGFGVREIARVLKRSPSTISEELNRKFTEYKADTAQKDSVLKRKLRRRKRKISGPLEALIICLLTEYRCSPEQISGYLRRKHRDCPELQISAEAIYLWVYSHSNRKALTQFLRRKYKNRRKKGERSFSRGGIKNRVSIRERPEEVKKREEVGHWEGDLIIGAKNQSAIGTLVERSSRYTILIKLCNKEARTVAREFVRFLIWFPSHLRRSLTYDNGSEMANHEEISKALEMPIYFADPHCPWQRGSNENTNGLIREFLLKGTDLSMHSQEYLGGLAALLNRRPRKVLGFHSPADVFDYLCENPNSHLSRYFSNQPAC